MSHVEPLRLDDLSGRHAATMALLHLLLNNEVTSGLAQGTSFDQVISVFIRHLFGQLFLDSTPLQLFIV